MKLEVTEDRYGKKAVYLDDYRITDRSTKPHGYFSVIATFDVDKDEIKKLLD